MKNEVRYAGFWIRFVASFLDTFLLALPVGIVIYFLSDGQWFDWAAYKQNIAYAMHGNANAALTQQPHTDLKWELLFEFAVLAVTVLFWRQWRGATPGKRMVGITVVDAKNFDELGNRQAITRSLSYIVSTLVLLMGFIMVAFRQDKRGLHDLIAGTAVIYTNETTQE
ncbi:MAG: RDD family protein [Campylobacterota bacterium]|nr:RDD family protein [Campylobacterota bacterium]